MLRWLRYGPWIWLCCFLPACFPDMGAALTSGDAGTTVASLPDAVQVDDVGIRDGGADAPKGDATSSPGSPDAGDKFAIGEDIFLRTAGGVGCANCHGETGGGDPSNNGPNIRGMDFGAVVAAIDDITDMADIRLTDFEVEAVVLYLQWLEDTYE